MRFCLRLSWTSEFKAEGLNLEMEVGRDSLWWGPGNHGSLLVTNNARPFDLVKLSNPYPFSLPILGLFRFNMFLSELDNQPPFIPDPLLYGLRLNFEPHPILEAGLSLVAIFDGEGRRDLSFADYFKVNFSTEHLEITNSKLDSNRQASFDLSVSWPNFDRILPIARSLKFYGERGGEDVGFLPTRTAHLIGILINDLFLTGRIDL